MRTWRLALIPVVGALVAALVISACAISAETAPTSSDYTGPKASSRVQADMRLDIEADQSTYYAGHPIKVRVSLVNTGNKEVTFTTPTTLVFDILYEAAGEPSVLRWSDGRQFAQVVTPHTLPAGGGISQVLELAIVPKGDAELWARLDTGTLVLDTGKITLKIE